MKNHDLKTLRARMMSSRSLELAPLRSRTDEWLGWGLLALCTLMIGGGLWEMAVTLATVPQRCVGML